MAATLHHCSFCGVEQSSDTPLIAGLDGHICESCVSLAHQVVNSWGRKRALAGPLKNPPRPREIKERLVERRSQPVRTGIGFHVEPEVAGDRMSKSQVFEETHPDDLRHFGLIPEFIGRFPVITALHDLEEDALVRILTEPRNALVSQYQQLFAFEGVRLDLTPEALKAIARKAKECGTGARGLRSVLEALLKRTMFELPSTPNVTVCRVDEAAVVGESEIELELCPGLADEPVRSLG